MGESMGSSFESFQVRLAARSIGGAMKQCEPKAYETGRYGEWLRMIRDGMSDMEILRACKEMDMVTLNVLRKIAGGTLSEGSVYGANPGQNAIKGEGYRDFEAAEDGKHEAGTQWPKEMRADAFALFERGMKNKQVGMALKASPDAVRSFRESYRIRRKHERQGTV